MAVRPTEGYERRVGGETAARPGTSAEAFGASAGAALAQGGAELHQDELRAKRIELSRQRQADAATAGVEFARMAGRIDVMTNGQREQAGPGAAGHVETVTASADTEITNFLGTIGNEQVRQAFTERAEELRSRVVGSEDGWERGQRVAHQGRQINETRRLMGLQIQAHPDAESYQDGREVIRSTIAAGGLRQDLAEDLEREQLALYARNYVEGLTEENPAGAVALLESNILQDLDPAARASLLDTAQVEVRVREAQARAGQADLRAAVNAEVQIMDRRFRDGDPTITDEQLAALQERARSAGLTPEVYDAGNYRIRRQMIQEFGPQSGQTPAQIRTALDAVDARIAAAGERGSPEDVIRRDQLNNLLTAATQQHQNDPYRGYVQRGGQMGPVSAADPSSIDRRIASMHGAHTTNYYTPQELPEMRELYASGPEGRLQAANEVAAIGARDPRAGELAAQQIAPNDRTFRMASRLNPQVRAQVLAGAEARRQMPQRIELADGTAGNFDNVSQRWFQANIAPQLSMMPPEYVNDALEGARSLYAERARQAGNLANPHFNGQAFGEAVSAVLGRTNGRGGTGFWNYGPRRVGIVLPSRMTQGELDRAMTYLPIARLGEHWAPGSNPNGPARYANGAAPSTDEIRERFVPVVVGDGLYEFRDANGGALMGANGRRFRLNVYALAAAPPPRARQTAQAPRLTRQQQQDLDRLRRPWTSTEAPEWGE